jgi:hypothetical protein
VTIFVVRFVACRCQRTKALRDLGRRSIVPEWEREKQGLYLVWMEDFATRFAESKFPQHGMQLA